MINHFPIELSQSTTKNSNISDTFLESIVLHYYIYVFCIASIYVYVHIYTYIYICIAAVVALPILITIYYSFDYTIQLKFIKFSCIRQNKSPHILLSFCNFPYCSETFVFSIKFKITLSISKIMHLPQKICYLLIGRLLNSYINF